MSGSIRHSFDTQLAELQQDVVRMGSLAAEAVQAALQALTGRDLTLCDRVMELENQIDDDESGHRVARAGTARHCSSPWHATCAPSRPCCG